MGTLSADRVAAGLRAADTGPLARMLASLVPIECYEITDPAAAAAANLLAATATTVAVQTYLKAGLLAPGLAALAAYPRRLTFTTAGATPADAPANVVITGLDANGSPISETLALAQTATLVTTVNFYADITSIVFAAGDGAAATVSIGIAASIGFKSKPKLRNAAVAATAEFTDGVPSGTRGTYITPAAGPPYGGVTFNTAPDAAHDYAVYFERDMS